ncbi:golgi-body localization protein domain-containing protein [Dipodascopsis tothii]|uniref:golgi-body localization protein domain-containing protein n=1 Tax=Dipodascopsis tothii TaxID=44089 RepID=UPI0034CDD93E
MPINEPVHNIKLDDDVDAEFNNRFIFHGIHLRWDNAIRNLILRYIHQIGQRRGLIYYMSRRAVKFIEDLVEDQELDREKREQASTADSSEAPAPKRTSHQFHHTHASEQHRDRRGTVQQVHSNADKDRKTTEKMLEQLLNESKDSVEDGQRCRWNAEAPAGCDNPDCTGCDNIVGHLTDGYLARNTYMVRLLGPQIQLLSDKNPESCMLVTSQTLELKIISVLDRAELEDDVSGLVQSRYSARLEDAQFFVFHKDDVLRQASTLFAKKTIGCLAGGPDGMWPPWLPMEGVLEWCGVGSSQIAERTSAYLTYDKHNSLRLKYADKVAHWGGGERGGDEHRLDTLSVDFRKIVAACDSAQYFTLYIIIMDLLMYAEPQQKRRNERLEKILLATDFSNLRGAAEMIERLQLEIRQIQEIQHEFLIYWPELDERGWEDNVALTNELAAAREELFFLMKAITMGQQRRRGERDFDGSVLQWHLSCQQLICHLLLEDRQPFVDIALADAAFRRLENQDGSNSNTIDIGMLQGVNLLKDALYPELLSPYFEGMQGPDPHRKAIEVYWYMLESIGGIPVMDHFEVNLIPLKIQLESEVGQKLFKYIFPDNDKSPFIVPGSTRSGSDSSGDSDSDSDASSTVSLAVQPTATKGGVRGLMPSLHRKKSADSVASLPRRRTTMSSDNSLRPRRRDASPTSVRSRVSTDTDRGRGLLGHTLGRRSSSHSLAGSGHLPPHASSIIADSDIRDDDDLSEMVSRASSFMTIGYMTIPSVMLCISYKGKGSRNIEDVHEFVFTLPKIEYRNKTWSNLDVAMHLKKDIIKALISHTGALIENKFKSRGHRKPAMPIRQISDYAQFTSLADLSTESALPSAHSTHSHAFKHKDRPKDGH